MAIKEIVCKKCGKKARIFSKNGVFCLKCWRKIRAIERKKRQKEALDVCFSYKNNKKVTEKEAKIINDVMEEMNLKRKKEVKNEKRRK